MVKAVVIGGSIGGLCVAHALREAGVTVEVWEKAPKVSAAGAGLGLDQHAGEVMASFGLAEQYDKVTMPLQKEHNCGINANRERVTASQDHTLNLKSTHWADIHQMLRKALPDSVVHNGKKVVSVEIKDSQVIIRVQPEDNTEANKKTQTEETKADFAIAADGSMSETWKRFNPDGKRRYSGYCAWRGVMEIEHNPEVASGIRKEYADIGNALYFDISNSEGHAVIYELPGKRLNWLWYVNQPEPELEGTSVTVQASKEKVRAMHDKADTVFPPALAALMKATATPFINAIYDREPLERFVYGRVALMGEAAHPTTPHGLRSTNMAIADAHCIGQAVKDSDGDIDKALQAYQAQRLQATRQEVLFSRWLGQLKQKLIHKEVDWTALPETLAHDIALRQRAKFDEKEVSLKP